MSGSVVVVGGGPGGVLLTYLLARGGVAVTLLEARGDFARRFRGDTLAPGVLEYLDRLGLADELLAEVPYTRSDAFRWHTAEKTWTLVDYRGASRRFPFYALMPQARFLPWMVERAQRYGARVEMGARFRTLCRDAAGRVSGVEYTVDAEPRRLDATLVVGSDGRSSKVRADAGVAATELGASLDLLWASLPREEADPSYSGLDLFARPGGTVALLDQGVTWQMGWSVPAGEFDRVRAEGVDTLLDDAVAMLPWIGPRLRETVTGPNDLTLLPVRITTVETWSTPGLLLLGDAAHVISPVGGNGINLALADAAEAANLLVDVLRHDVVEPAAVDAAASELERRRRPGTEREQQRQVRTERAAADRRRADDPRPPGPLRVLSSIPGVPRLLGRRSGVRVADPVPTIASGDGR